MPTVFGRGAELRGSFPTLSPGVRIHREGWSSSTLHRDVSMYACNYRILPVPHLARLQATIAAALYYKQDCVESTLAVLIIKPNFKNHKSRKPHQHIDGDSMTVATIN